MNTAATPVTPRIRGFRRVIVLCAGVVLFVAGCADSGTDSSAESTTTAPPASQPAGGEAEGTPAPTTPEPAELAAWQQIDVTDANGETFAIGDLVGRPVLVENFATWCSNCRKQLGDTQKAAAAAGESAVFVALSVETELDASDMADYAKQHGFTDIRFAVMSDDLLGAMYDAYGNTALNPPSTPKIAVASDGSAGELVTGFESPEKLRTALGLS